MSKTYTCDFYCELRKRGHYHGWELDLEASKWSLRLHTMTVTVAGALTAPGQDDVCWMGRYVDTHRAKLEQHMREKYPSIEFESWEHESHELKVASFTTFVYVDRDTTDKNDEKEKNDQNDKTKTPKMSRVIVPETPPSPKCSPTQFIPQTTTGAPSLTRLKSVRKLF